MMASRKGYDILYYILTKALDIIFIGLDLLLRISMCYVTKSKHAIIVELLNLTKS